MRKGRGAPPAKEERRNNANSLIPSREYKAFDWFFQNCAQPMMEGNNVA